MIPLVVDMDRVMADVHWLVEEIGPRESRSVAEQAAVKGVIARLEQAGWSVIPNLDSPLACRGNGGRLFLAHVDTVPGSPGAIDNAGSVAVLLELARTTHARDLCLGFPVQEEIGLVGSTQMAHSWDSLGLNPLELVVAAEFSGDGTPAAMDLWSAWGHEELAWLVNHTEISIPFRHHIVGRTMPAWRSDHAPFAAMDILSFKMWNRSAEGVHTRYHQASDDSVNPESLHASIQMFEQMATAPPIQRGSGDPAFRLGTWVLPGWISWLIIGAGLLSGMRGLPQWKASIADLIRTGVAALVGGGTMYIITIIGFPVHEAERTAHNVLGLSTSGWWLAAPWAIGLGWIAWFWMWRKLPGQGHPSLGAAILVLVTLLMGPLLALPFAVTALLVRIHPLLGVTPVILWMQPAVLREITFYGLAAPWMWSLLFLATWPAFGRAQRRGHTP